MNLLFYKDLILDYISKNIKTGEHLRLIEKIFDNENSKLLYSNKFFQYIEEEIDSKYRPELYALMTKFFDEGEIIESSKTTTNFDEEVLSIYQKFTKSTINIFSYKEPNEIITKNIKNVVIISKYKKPNYHWLVTELAIMHPKKVTVNCFDFNYDKEIKQFIEDIFKIPKYVSRVNILDRQTRDFNHDRFDIFKDTIPVYYYTYQHKYYFQDEPLIKSCFKKIRIFTTRKINITHSRKLIFESIVIISDNDFNNLIIGGDWNIDIQFSQKDEQNWLSRCKNAANYQETR
jgi:hypothetical protein